MSYSCFRPYWLSFFSLPPIQTGGNKNQHFIKRRLCPVIHISWILVREYVLWNNQLIQPCYDSGWKLKTTPLHSRNPGKAQGSKFPTVWKVLKQDFDPHPLVHFTFYFSAFLTASPVYIVLCDHRTMLFAAQDVLRYDACFPMNSFWWWWFWQHHRFKLKVTRRAEEGVVCNNDLQIVLIS